MKTRTALIANSNLLKDDKLYLKRARQALPILVLQAKAGQPILYSDLAEQLDMPNPRNLNYVLGAIGRALIELEKITKRDIPQIQSLVVNKKDRLPGDGIGGFLTEFNFDDLNKTQKQKVVALLLLKISTYSDWDWVLNQLGLRPLSTSLNDEISAAKQMRGTGESENHRKFKEYIFNNPFSVGLKSIDFKQKEYDLPSADRLDLLFKVKDLWCGVEVKSSISSVADILRGLFQCIKYKHLIEAEQAVNGLVLNSRVILALQGSLPNELLIAKNILGIEVIENIQSKK